MDKFALLYEFDQKSPLLVYKAAQEIEERNISNAIELLNTSIEKYPYYATAYFLLATALAYNNEYDKISEMISKGSNILDDDETALYYTNLVEKIKRENAGIDNSFEETISDVLDESFHVDDSEFYNFDDLNLVDEKIEDTKQIPTATKSKITEGTIVTETLAEIYNSQGNYTEALDIYERLLKLQPDKSVKFNKKILEINNTIGKQ